MKVPTKDLTGLALRWASAKAAGYEPEIRGNANSRWIGAVLYGLTHTNVLVWEPDENWKQAGKLLDLLQIELNPVYDCGKFVCWWARRPLSMKWSDVDGEYIDGSDGFSEGPTAQVALLRCAITDHFGPEVDIPEELLC